MNELLELSELITDKRRTHNTDKSRRYDKAIKKLQDTENVSDAELAEHVGMRADEDRFKMFKTRLKSRLIKAILHESLPARLTTPYNKAYLYCSIRQYTVRFLVLLNSRPIAASLAKEGLAKAQKFDFTEFIYYFSGVLRMDASVNGKLKDFEYYNSLTKKSLKILTSEDEGNRLTEFILAAHARNTVWPTELVKTVQGFCDRVSRLRQEYDSYSLTISHFRLQGDLFYAQQDFEGALKNWIEFEGYINERAAYDNTARIREAFLHQLSCRIHLLQFGAAGKLAEKCKPLVRKGLSSWYTYMEILFLLEMFRKNYAEAREIYYQAISEKKLSTLPDIQVERWEIFGAYIDLLQRIIPELGQQGSAQSKRIKTMLRNTTAQVKDKQGYNVTILVIQILWDLYDKNYKDVTDRIDALRVYAGRYLKGQEYKRSYLFFKMIQQAEKVLFDYEKTRQVTAKYLDQLKTLSEIDSRKKIDGMEVIPYPHLWEMVLSLLKRDK